MIEARGFVPQVIYYDMSMQGLARKGDIEAGFNLLDRAEAKCLLSQCDQSCYVIPHTLLEACRIVGNQSAA